MKKIAPVLTLALFIACGKAGAPNIPTKGIANDQDATKAALEVNTTIQGLAGMAMPARAAVSVERNVKISCPSGGSATGKISVTGDTTATAAAATATSTYELAFAACTSGDKKLTGSITWSANFSTADGKTNLTASLDGAIAYEGPVYGGTFSFNAMKLTYTADSVAKTFNVDVAGSYTIGGKTYQIDKMAFGSAFGL